MAGLIEIGKVFESSPSQIVIRIDNDMHFESNKKELQIGKYLQIQNGNNQFVLSAIQNLKISSNGVSDNYFINTQPIGLINAEGAFKSGTVSLPSPTEKAYIPEKSTLESVFIKNDEFSFEIGSLIQNNDIKLSIDGNKFFGKHIGIVGSTGSGKSCAVASILQNAIGFKGGLNIHKNNQKNSHIIIFDIHSEYKSAFTLDKEQNFTLNVLDVEKLKLPYWLLNSEELEAMFIESSEQNSHNQISQFKKAVILNKEKHNPSLTNITYDTPVYFSIEEVYNYICNLNYCTVYSEADKTYFGLASGKVEYNEEKFWELMTFVESTGNSKHETLNVKVRKGNAFNGEFDRFISRLETKLKDKRLSFILNPLKDDGGVYNSNDFEAILKQFLGYLNKSNVSIIDLSGIPFEVLSITVSLISRLVFDFAFHYSKLRHDKDMLNDIPFMIVCEEAHNYIPKTNTSEYRASKKSIERIAKEGRKYGLSLMVVSQRPSEVSDTIFSQCNNFVALRLTNITDQSYIKGLLPDNSSAIADTLSTLSAGECIIVGDATPLSSIVKMDMPNPEPKSESIKFHKEWNENWKDFSDKDELNFESIIKRWKRE